MPRKKHQPEEIVAKLRQVDVLLSQGRSVSEAVRTISVTPFTYSRWRKESGGLTFVGLDTGMNHLLRPALYGAYHRIVNLSVPDAPLEWVEVVGNVCETTDVLASNRPLPRPEEGHLLAFLDAGAYGYSMASRYNLWPLPREVAVTMSGTAPRVTASQ